MLISRRDAVRRLSGTAMLLAAGRLRSSESPVQMRLPSAPPRFDRYPFTLGIASGQPRPDSVVLWTRLAPEPHAEGGGMDPLPVPLRWEMAHDEAFTQLVRTGEVVALPSLAHSVRIQVDRLPPGRVFHYRFITGHAVSAIGRTRTAPPADSQPARLRLALASCQHYEQGRFTVHREIAASDIDLVLFVGDYIYDSSHPSFLRRPHEGPPPETLDQFRARHATYKLDLDLQAAHAAHPWILAWDDHEVRNDYAAALGTGELSAAEFVRIRAAAYQAYFEHLPLALDQIPGERGMRMHDHYTWGRLAELWTLDGRQHRSVQACNAADESGGHLRWYCDELADRQRSLLGPAQESWLHRGLAHSQRRWKLIGQATQMSASGLETLGRQLVHTDGWDGYASSRARLLQHLADRGVQDVVALGGDVHRHVVANLRVRPNDERSAVVASEFVTTSLTTRGIPESWMSLIRSSNPDILHGRSDERGYALIELGNQSLHLTARATGFPVTESSLLHTQASYSVESGRAGPQQA